jgi:hypothetical protein
MLAQQGYEGRKVPGNACRFHVAAFAHGDVHAVKAEPGGGGRQFFALYKLQVLGEYRYLEIRLGWGRAAQQECTAGQQGAAR